MMKIEEKKIGDNVVKDLCDEVVKTPCDDVTLHADSPIFSIKADKDLIERAVDGKWVKELAFFYLVKQEFQNGRIYKGQYRARVAERLGISEKTVERRINVLIRKRLITTDGYALILERNPGKQSTRLVRIKHHEIPSLEDMKYLLYAAVLRNAAVKQELMLSIKQYALSNDCNKNQDKSISGDAYKASLSVRYMGKLLNMSFQQASAISHKLKEMGVISIIPQKARHCGKMNKEGLKHLDGVNYGKRFIGDNNEMFEHPPSKIEFDTRPVPVRLITPQRWKRLMRDPFLRDYVNRIYEEHKNGLC